MSVLSLSDSDVGVMQKPEPLVLELCTHTPGSGEAEGEDPGEGGAVVDPPAVPHQQGEPADKGQHV